MDRSTPELSTHKGKAAFDVGKKIIDIADDAWNATRSVLPKTLVTTINPFLIGGLGALIHCFEAYGAGKRAIRALKDKKTLQRKTKIVTGAASFVCGGTGAGLSVTVIVGGLGIPITSFGVYFPIIIPALLTTIYTLSLFRHSYRLHTAKKMEVEAKKVLSNLDAAHCDANEIAQATSNALFWQQERLKSERKVAFTTIEVLASSIVLAGTVLAVGAGLALFSIATFGIPLALLITGVALGVGVKIFERVDKKKDYAMTQKIRNSVISVWNNTFVHAPQVRSEAVRNAQPDINSSTAAIFSKMNTQPDIPQYVEKTYKDDRAEEDLASDLHVPPMQSFFSKMIHLFAHGKSINTKVPTPVYYHALKL